MKNNYSNNFNTSSIEALVKKRRFSIFLEMFHSKWFLILMKILKLIIEIVVLTWLVFTIVFILFNFVPGEPKLISDARQNGQESTVLFLQDYFHVGPEYGFFERYWYAIKSLFDGTMGYSWTTGEAISTTFWDHFSISLTIGLIAFATSFLIGIPFGTYIARHKSLSSDFWSSLGFVLAFALPAYALALVIVLVNSFLGIPILFDYKNFYIILLSSFILSIPIAFLHSRNLKNGIRFEEQQPYQQLSKMSGKSSTNIFWKETIWPASFSIINYTPYIIVVTLFGSVALESVFSIPGTGSMLINAAIEHDQPTFLDVVTIYSVFIITSFAVRDFIIKFSDPRVKA